jgi:hypothetical protein
MVEVWLRYSNQIGGCISIDLSSASFILRSCGIVRQRAIIRPMIEAVIN